MKLIYIHVRNIKIYVLFILNFSHILSHLNDTN